MCALWFRQAVGIVALGGIVLAAGCQGRGPEQEIPSAQPSVANPVPDAPAPARESSADAVKPETAAPPEPSGWGHLSGRFVFDGAPPAPRALTITSDKEFCSLHNPQDESIVVHSGNSGLANVVVTLSPSRTEPSPAVHDSYGATAAAKVQLDNQKCRFQPHVLAMRTSQTLEILNSDEVAHNTKIDTLKNPPINFTLPAGGSLEQRFAVEERAPAQVSCSIHPWMVAWVVVRKDPYFAVADANGAFTIQNLPAGKWTFQAWHEQARFIARVRQQDQPAEWDRGRFIAEIKPNETTDLGEIRVERSLFGGR